jgi:hypothetical protein
VQQRSRKTSRSADSSASRTRSARVCMPTAPVRESFTTPTPDSTPTGRCASLVHLESGALR